MSDAELALEHRVYIHRVPDGRMYVGRDGLDRAASHASGSHNPEVDRIIQAPGATLEVVDLPSAEAAEIAEGLLIDVLSRIDGVHLVNARGEHWRFQPLGVPAHLEHRSRQSALPLAELGRQLGGESFFKAPRASSMRRAHERTSPAPTQQRWSRMRCGTGGWATGGINGRKILPSPRAF